MMEAALDQHLRTALEAALAKSAGEPVALDVSDVCSFAHTLIICHGSSSRQVQTITDAVRDALRKEGKRPHHVEGEQRGEWVLMDYLDFVIHIFQEERRRFFALERLWGDAPRLDLGGLAGFDDSAASGARAGS
jgi:ribosome-associated protein